MQQVKSETLLAGARVVDPRALPVLIHRPRHKLANHINRALVLHGGLIRRGAMIAMVLAAGFALFQMREPIGQLGNTLGGIAQGNFAQAGLAIGEISISGQTLTAEQDIFDALGIQPHTSTLGFDVEAARQRVAELPAVEEVIVRKTYPGDVDVLITEKAPVARWAVDGVTFLIDGRGEQIAEASPAYSGLPLVIGDGAADDALVMIRALNGFPLLQDGLVALSRIADRRWDMIFDTGLRVQLPEQGVAQAMARLVTYQQDYQLLDRDVSVIDLRVDSVVAVRPNKTDEDTDKS
ncbi:cell division protein FtsQ [Devosia subaequoris]|uniref:Cell division protein FtsQ n=1 Tax=Devosia subaequoris TaxID=395930 RepID=A0A7W6NB50_9HYPH|nr:cell division protein FtsQ/DivIB [Devosia subaequoris]MBB4051612.1 cell division protein FtsQ [Devosia subaequoris]MCP1209202.1 cell division protein FtsQ/DivIB [Devosia subaequoris]